MKQIKIAALLAAMPAGVQMVRGEVDPSAVLADLQKSVQALRDENETQLKAKADDVLVNEKIDRINAEVSKLQSAMDEHARKVEAAALNGNGRTIPDPEYSKAFAGFIKNGEVNASLNKTTDADGGYLAPSEWDRTITDKLVEVSPMREIATVQTTSVGAFKKLFNLRGTASGWVDEDDARAETAGPTFGSMEFASGEIYANVAATQQLLEDAEVDLESWLAGEIQTEFAKQEGGAFVSGSGAKRPAGFLAFTAGGAKTGVHPLGDIAQVNSGNAALVTADGVVNLTYALPSIYRGGARFVMNRAAEGKVRLLKDGQNNYLWQPSYAAGTPATLNGYPITELPDMPDVAANALALAFGDFKRGYLINDRVSTSILRDPYTNKPYVMFYARKRVGGAVLDSQALRIQKIAA